MNLKKFFIASLIIHSIGALALYFYYNPTTFTPQPAGFFEEEKNEKEATTQIPPETVQNKKLERRQSPDSLKNPNQKKLTELKTKSFKAIKRKKIIKKKEPTNSVTEKSQIEELEETHPNISETAGALDSSQNEALSEAVDPLPEIPKKAVETIESPVNLNLEEIKEEQKSFLNTEEPKENSENQEKDLLKTNIHPNSTIKQKSPKDLEDESEEFTDEPKNLKGENKKSNEGLSDVEKKPEKESSEKDKASKKNKIEVFQNLKQRLGNPSLSYPDFARRQKMQGIVSVLFFVTAQGLVEQIQLVSSSGHAELDNFVLRVLARYEFLPGQESWVSLDVSFKLEGKEQETPRWRQE